MAARAVAVIGPGALGLLYASRLSKVVPTAVIARNAARATELRRGVKVVPVALGKTLLPRGFEPLAAYLRRAGFPVQVTRKIGAARLQKLLANVCINPVTALFRIRNGAIRKHPYRGLAEVLAREAAPVLSREGLEITAAEAVSRVMDVARITAQNRSSMLQDLLAGRKTEREHLTGALLRLARRHRVAVPTHRALYEVIRVMESR